MTKKKPKHKQKNFKNINGSIINNKSSIYIHSVRSLDGKKPDKRTCIFYDKDTQKCTNNKCSIIICTTAHNCTCYKRKQKEPKQKLSPYNDTYTPLPYKSSIHESDNRFIGMSKNIGTPVHGEYLKSDGYRRHKARCIYYNKKTKLCTWFSHKCIGSSHCNKYQEY